MTDSCFVGAKVCSHSDSRAFDTNLVGKCFRVASPSSSASFRSSGSQMNGSVQSQQPDAPFGDGGGQRCRLPALQDATRLPKSGRETMNRAGADIGSKRARPSRQRLTEGVLIGGNERAFSLGSSGRLLVSAALNQFGSALIVVRLRKTSAELLPSVSGQSQASAINMERLIWLVNQFGSGLSWLARRRWPSTIARREWAFAFAGRKPFRFGRQPQLVDRPLESGQSGRLRAQANSRSLARSLFLDDQAWRRTKSSRRSTLSSPVYGRVESANTGCQASEPFSEPI